MNRERTEPTTDRDQWCLRAEDGAQAERGQRGQDDTDQIPGTGRRATGLETEGRRMAPVARQEADYQPRQQTAEHQPRKRPPCRHRAADQLAGKVVKDPFLQPADQGQEAIRHRRDRNSQERSQDKSRQISLRPDRRNRIHGGCCGTFWRSRGLRGGTGRAVRIAHRCACRRQLEQVLQSMTRCSTVSPLSPASFAGGDETSVPPARPDYPKRPPMGHRSTMPRSRVPTSATRIRWCRAA